MIKTLSTDEFDKISIKPEHNINVNFISNSGFWIFYVILNLSILYFLSLFHINTNVYWTIYSGIYQFLSFFFLHLIKGAALQNSYTDGKYDKLTFWEQMR
jgi:hypothetical protein